MGEEECWQDQLCCALRRGPSGPTEGNVKHRASVFISPRRHAAWLRPACSSSLGVLGRNHGLSMTIFTSLLPWGALNTEDGGGFLGISRSLWATSFSHRACSGLGQGRGEGLLWKKIHGDQDLQTLTMATCGEGKRTLTLSSACPPPCSSWVSFCFVSFYMSTWRWEQCPYLLFHFCPLWTWVPTCRCSVYRREGGRAEGQRGAFHVCQVC